MNVYETIWFYDVMIGRHNPVGGGSIIHSLFRNDHSNVLIFRN